MDKFHISEVLKRKKIENSIKFHTPPLCGVSHIGEVSQSDGGVKNITSFLLMGLKPTSHQAVCIGYSTPSPAGTPPIFLTGTQGEGEIHYPVPVIEGIHTSLLYFALQSTRGEGVIHFKQESNSP